MNTIMLKAYAKINLGLDVLGKREDGYHEVRMIMQTIRLYDKLNMKKLNKDEIIIKTNLSYLPTNENNLVYRAIQMLKEEFNIKQGIYVELQKHIPVAAGLAGGSSDAAAALTGMNRLFQLKLTTTDLMQRAVKLGADIPYCILGGTALSEGIGEVLTPLAPMPKAYVLIAKPPINVSTKYVYENLILDERTNHPDIDGIMEAINSKDLCGVTNRLSNVLESVTIDKYPVIQEIKDTMIEFGAMNALMSGSGPTVFGIFEDLNLAKKAFYQLKIQGKAKQIYLTDIFNRKRG
ncbi:4-diphosphocytidyl-2-C-methyl-D-erythritol kinase [Anaerosporobacter mobilis DSM 15930]|uniref:4-diphosphocytidyl-2-C-methyl-D-erythritol kinase n=1 Tax=Anaerosporobacter mobilis DSM 15930 TaxID=1120996 RepID=A0A1M7FYY4_9FIRM|nr:4-(cytidine 5'-diphospho)-2-C-methyl-D-erythritol kinase [Anaerosporobacter mobilis]SHM09261.1 4-diphosphocytidyl-2-C-methyl-D-erythritol kinase [Anaerosporobacter mobilis DSM 15930]